MELITSLRGPGLQLHLSRPSSPDSEVAAAAGPDSSAGGVGEKKNEGFLETYFPSTSNAVESVCKSILIEA